MVKILPVLLIQFSSFLFGQNAAQLESQRVAEQNYKIQVSNGAFEKAIDEMSSSARKSSQEKINQIDDDFEFNFAEKAKIESKINSILEKKIAVKNKLSKAKSDIDKNDFLQKLDSLNIDLEKLKSKLAQNEAELKILQESYRNLTK